MSASSSRSSRMAEGTRADCEATQEKALPAPPVLALGFKQDQEEGFLRQSTHIKTHTSRFSLRRPDPQPFTGLHLEILDFGLHRVHSQLISDRLNARSAARGHCARSSNRCRRCLSSPAHSQGADGRCYSERSANAGVSRSSYGVVTMSNPKTEPTDNTQKNPTSGSPAMIR